MNQDLRVELERSISDADAALAKVGAEIRVLMSAKESLQVEMDRSAESLVALAAEKVLLQAELGDALSTKAAAAAEAAAEESRAREQIAILSTKIDGLLAGLEVRKSQSVVDEQRAKDQIADLDKEKHVLSLELEKAKEQAAIGRDVAEKEVSVLRADVASVHRKLGEKARELHALQCLFDTSALQVESLSKQLEGFEDATASAPIAQDDSRELSAIQFRLDESRAQVSALSKQLADSEEEVASGRSRLQSEIFKNEGSQKEIKLLREVSPSAPSSEMSGIIASLTSTLKEVRDKGAANVIKVAELQAVIAAHESEALQSPKSKAAQFAPFTGSPSCYLCRSTLDSIGEDEERNRLLNAEAARVRGLNEDLAALIAAEEKKTVELKIAAGTFSFENPMNRSHGKSPKGPVTKPSVDMKGAEETKSGSVAEKERKAELENQTRLLALTAEEKQKGIALAAAVAEVLGDNDLKASDLAAALRERELLMDAINAEEDRALSLQDRAAEIMEEKALRCSVAAEEERALALLAEATNSSREHFMAASALYEAEKGRAEVAERERVDASEALAKAKERNDQLSASLAAEEQKTIALQAAVAAAQQANRDKAAAASLTEKTTQVISANLDKARAEIAEKEKQLEIQGGKSLRLSAALKDVSGSEDMSSLVSGSLSPLESPRDRKGKGLSVKLEDFENDSGGSDNSQRRRPSLKSIRSPCSDTVPPSSSSFRGAGRTPSSPHPMSGFFGASEMRSPRSSFIQVDKIPFTKPTLGRVPKSEEPRVMTALENEAKIVAERIRSKRDAIRTAVDGSLAAKSRSGKDIFPFIRTQSMNSRDKASAADEEDDCAGPLKAASESLVSEPRLNMKTDR